MRWNGTRIFQKTTQSEPRKRFLAAPADEFAADAVARIIPRLVNRDRHAALPQPDAERQPRQTAADNLMDLPWTWSFYPLGAR